MENISKKEKFKKWIDNILDFVTIVIYIVFLFLFLGLILFIFYIWDVEKTDKIIDFLRGASWPIFAFVFIFLFKKNIARFIDELKHLKIFGNEAIREPQVPNQADNIDVDKISEKVEEKSGSIQDDYSELEKTKKYLEFERIYNLIFGSQIELLDTMKLNKDGLNINFLQIFFYNIQNKFKIALGSWTLIGYLRFLETNELILFDNRLNNYSITNKGKEFLNYIELLRYPKNKNL